MKGVQANVPNEGSRLLLFKQHQSSCSQAETIAPAKQQRLTQRGHAGGGVSGAGADEGGTSGGVTGGQAQVDDVLACSRSMNHQ